MTDPETVAKDIYSTKVSSAPQTGPVTAAAAVPGSREALTE